MNGTVVGVLRGGPSREHEVSMLSGHAVVSNIPRDKFTVRDIYIDKQGIWHERGKASTPSDILRTTDVVFNALHGEYGEDGEVQRLLERFGVPYTGSTALASYMAMHKVFAKELATHSGIKTPKYVHVEPSSNIQEVTYGVIRSFNQPVIVKPTRWGSSLGITIVGGYAPVYHAIEALLKESETVIVEEYIRGTEATIGIVEHMRDEMLYALPPVEILPPANDFYSYTAKYGGTHLTRGTEIMPGRFSKQVVDDLTHAARTMHTALGLRHYSRSDFIVSPRGVYYLETNSLPALGAQSLFGKEVAAVGITAAQFLEHVLDLARNPREATSPGV